MYKRNYQKMRKINEGGKVLQSRIKLFCVQVQKFLHRAHFLSAAVHLIIRIAKRILFLGNYYNL